MFRVVTPAVNHGHHSVLERFVRFLSHVVFTQGVLEAQVELVVSAESSPAPVRLFTMAGATSAVNVNGEVLGEFVVQPPSTAGRVAVAYLECRVLEPDQTAASSLPT